MVFQIFIPARLCERRTAGYHGANLCVARIFVLRPSQHTSVLNLTSHDDDEFS
jgi:hypothetical protein